MFFNGNERNNIVKEKQESRVCNYLTCPIKNVGKIPFPIPVTFELLDYSFILKNGNNIATKQSVMY